MNRILLLFLIAGLTCTGCKDPGSAKNKADTNTADKPFDITSMVTVDEIKSALSDDDRPESAEQLRDDFVRMLKADPERALVDFSDWESIPESKRKIKLGGLLTIPFSIGRDRQYELSNAKLYSVAEYGKLIGCTVEEYNQGRETPITHVLELEYKLGENGTQTGTVDVGTRDGHFFLYPDAD